MKVNLYATTMSRLCPVVLVLFFAMLQTACNKDDDHLFRNTDLCLVEINGTFQEMELDTVPEYLDGGEEGFYQAIGENISYPPEARANSIEGLCVVTYEITQVGKVENIQAVQDPGGGIGESAIETLSIVTAGTSFSPGILNGNPIRVKKGLELKYKLE